MVRKSSIAAVALGVALIAAGIVCVAASPTLLPDDDTAIPWALAGSLNACTLGAACFWWPLATRRRVPAHPVLRAAGYAVGVLCFLCVAAILSIEAEFGGSDVLAAFAALYGLTLTVHVAALCWFLRRPRLLLTWVLGVLLAPLFFAVLYMLFFPRQIWMSEALIFYVAFLMWWGPTVAPLLGLPFAWVWVKVAEKHRGPADGERLLKGPEQARTGVQPDH